MASKAKIRHELTIQLYERFGTVYSNDVKLIDFILEREEKVIETEKLRKCCLCDGNPCQCKR